MAAPRTPRPGAESGNPDLPISTPYQNNMGADHSFTLQAIMEMQKSMGALESTVKSLVVEIGSQKQPMDDLKKKIAHIEKLIYAAGVVMTIFVCVGGWSVITMKDVAIMYYRASLDAQARPTPAMQSPQVAQPPQQHKTP